MELSKTDKKIARQLIDKSVLIEFGEHLAASKLILEQWTNQELDNRAAYLSLFTQVKTVDKHIARRYDGLSGGNFLNRVMDLYAENILKDDDIALFSAEMRDKLFYLKQEIWK
jgi:hypothetical protein